MKKYTGKKYGVFDTQGNKVGHASHTGEAHQQLGVTPKVSAPEVHTGAIFATTPKPSAPAAPAFVQKTDAEIAAMPAKDKAFHLGQAVNHLGSGHAYTQKVFTSMNPELQAPPPKPTMHSEAPSNIAFNEGLKKVYDDNNQFVGWASNNTDTAPGAKKYEVFDKQGKMLGTAQNPLIHFSEVTPNLDIVPKSANTYSPTYGVVKPLPQYAQGGTKLASGHTVAKLPSPMKKSSGGYNFAVFDQKGNKVGYAHTMSGAILVANGQKQSSATPAPGAPKHSWTPVLAKQSSEFKSAPTDLAKRQLQKSRMTASQKEAWQRYTDGHYHGMNEVAHGGQGDGYHASHEQIALQNKNLTEAFDAVGFKTTGTETVYRGTGSHAYFAKVGDIVGTRGFTSTSVQHQSSKSFAGYHNPLLKITLPPGQKYLLGTEGEREIILPPGVKMRVLAVDSQGRATDLEVIK
jgi:hypothetical protein